MLQIYELKETGHLDQLDQLFKACLMVCDIAEKNNEYSEMLNYSEKI